MVAKGFLSLVILLVIVCTLPSCLDRPQVPIAPDVSGKIGDTSYVPVLPTLDDYAHPSDVFIGREPFVYVADTDNNRIVQLDVSGSRIGISKPIKHPVAISQDGFFDLLVCGEIDTVFNGTTATLSGVFRVKLKPVNHLIASADIQLVYFEPQKPQRVFTAVTVFGDNSYLVARTGPNNTSRTDPDNAVLQFDRNDKFIAPVPALRPEGNALNSISECSGISAVNTRLKDFAFCQRGTNQQYRVQWMVFSVGEISDWGKKFDPTISQNDLLTVNRFTDPEDLTFDEVANLFVVDAGKDSLFRFNSLGMERYSFGGKGTSPLQFSSPKGVAYFDKTLWVADSGNNRILRFKLSTDVE